MEETVTAAPAKIADMKKQLSDVLMVLPWREMAWQYFHKSSSWLYHKLDGIDGNGGKGGFTPEEVQQLKGALYDVADRIRHAADSIH